MRLVLLVALATLLTPVGVAEDGVYMDDEGRVMLYAHWPASVAQGMTEPIPMDEIPPIQEPDLSEGPATPGSNTAGTEHTWTYSLTDFFGRIGPIGDLRLDTSTPALFHFYLSADQTPWPSPAGDPPQEIDHGVAPNVTVEVTLIHQDQTVAHGSQTHDLVNLPDPIGGDVRHVAVPLPLDLAGIPSGTGLDVQITVHQSEIAGQRVMQPLYNVHTGEAYPTGLALPIENPNGLFYDPDALDGSSVDQAREKLSAMSVKSTDEAPYAWTALIAAVAVMGLAGARLVHGWRQG